MFLQNVPICVYLVGLFLQAYVYTYTDNFYFANFPKRFIHDENPYVQEEYLLHFNNKFFMSCNKIPSDSFG